MTEALCKLCIVTINVSTMGISAIRRHSENPSHKKKVLAGKSSKLLDRFFCKKESQEEINVLVIETCKIYHAVKHNQSYNSLDCSIKLNKILFSDSSIAAKLSCGRTKSEAIVLNVLAPKALRIVLDILNTHTPKMFFSIQLDASNRKNVKFFPISVQFFSIECGLQNYLLQFSENSDETAEGMFNMVDACFKNHDLDFKYVSALSADNTNSNFGKNKVCLRKLKN